MMFKFFRLIPSDCFFWRLTLPLSVCFLFFPATVPAQEPPSPSPASRQALAYVRFWNMLPGRNLPLLELLSAEDKPLATATAYNYTATYNSIPPGTYTFVVRRKGDVANPLKKQAVILRADTFITFLASEKNGQPTVDLLDDTLDPKKANNYSQLVIRQFMPGALVTVSAASASSPAIPYGGSATLNNLANGNTSISMKATGLGPDPKSWNTEADFTSAYHATLLVVPDPYGRFRPRLAYDGQFGARPDPTPPPSPKP